MSSCGTESVVEQPARKEMEMTGRWVTSEETNIILLKRMIREWR
jgi:hypothetical protein